MSLEYRKPGVYVEESLRVGSADVGAANTATLFVGASNTGPIDAPVRVGSWSEYVSVFGGFDKVVSDGDEHLSYLPYAVYCYFQNGGRPAYCMRSTPTSAGAGSAGIGYATTTVETDLDVEAATYDDATNLVTVTITGHGLVTGDEVYVEYQATGDADFEYLKAGGVKAPVTVTGVDTFTYPSSTAGDPGALALSVGANKVFAYLERSFKIESKFSGAASPTVEVYPLADDPDVFHLTVLIDGAVVESFRYQGMSTGVDGVANLVDQVNDAFNGSKYIRVSTTAPAVNYSGAPGAVTVSLNGGTDPDLPGSEDLRASVVAAVNAIDQPVLVNVPGYLGASGDYISVSPSSSDVPNRRDVFYINDNVERRPSGMSNTSYYSSKLAPALAALAGDSYVAAYGPWITIPNPASRGTITVPPGGAVAGVFSRVDATTGVFRAPAGVIAGISNAIGVDAQFSDSELGTLNARNINVIRTVAGQGVCIMGARTRKPYGVDRYVNARRTLIYIRESLRRSTEYALFENNDQRLWNQLHGTADRILRPLWEAGGLKGTSSADAYFIKCDADVNPPQVVESGEVRMEVGVALETPAEFIVIRITQYERGGITANVI